MSTNFYYLSDKCSRCGHKISEGEVYEKIHIGKRVVLDGEITFLWAIKLKELTPLKDDSLQPQIFGPYNTKYSLDQFFVEIGLCRHDYESIGMEFS